MTTNERIKRIANKAKLPCSAIKILVYSVFGKTNNTTDIVENNLKILEKQYGI